MKLSIIISLSIVVLLAIGSIFYLYSSNTTSPEVIGGNVTNQTVFPSINVTNQTVSPSINVTNQTNAQAGTSVLVNMIDFTFIPSIITIKAGTTVIWTNGESVQHTVTSDSGSELKSGFMNKGETYEHQFNKPGVYYYHSTPQNYMRGRVIVE
jgi:plastocyanin